MEHPAVLEGSVVLVVRRVEKVMLEAPEAAHAVVGSRSPTRNNVLDLM